MLAERPDLFTLLISHVWILNVMPSKLFSIPFTRRHVLLSAEGEQHLDNSFSFNWSARSSLSFRVTRDGQPKLKKEKIHTMLPARHGTAGKTSLSRRLSCCRTRAHEEWILKWFVHSKGQIKTSCPHCKQTIFPVNLTEGPPWCISSVFFQSKTNSGTTPRVVRLSQAWSGYACLGSKLKRKL